MLEDCKGGLDVRIARRFSIVENPSRCEGTKCTLKYEMGTRIALLCPLLSCTLFFFNFLSKFIHLILEKIKGEESLFKPRRIKKT